VPIVNGQFEEIFCSVRCCINSCCAILSWYVSMPFSYHNTRCLPKREDSAIQLINRSIVLLMLKPTLRSWISYIARSLWESHLIQAAEGVSSHCQISKQWLYPRIHLSVWTLTSCPPWKLIYLNQPGKPDRSIYCWKTTEAALSADIMFIQSSNTRNSPAILPR
jgi:hypothetical protein